MVVATFGYTQCPDVCPMTPTVLAQVMRELGADAKRVQVMFITVDPERDSARLLARCVPAFDAAFPWLRGSSEETARSAERFDVDYRKQPGGTSGSYSVDHTAASFIIDPKGQLRVVVAYGQDANAFVCDIRPAARGVSRKLKSAGARLSPSPPLIRSRPNCLCTGTGLALCCDAGSPRR